MREEIGDKLDYIINLLEDKVQADNNKAMTLNELIVYINYRYRKATIYSMVCNGKIPHTKKPLRFNKLEIDNWLRNKNKPVKL